MANQALIESARRMYQAQAQVTDITPVLEAATSSISNITKAITEKRKDQEKRSEKEVKTNFINIIKNNPNISPDLVQQLNDTQDAYFDEMKKSENLFLGKKKRKDATDKLRDIEGELTALEKSLVNVDLKRAETPRGQVSAWNSTAEQAMDVMFHDDTMLSKNIIFKDRVAYLKTVGYKQENSFESNLEDKGVIRLDEYKPAMTKHETAFTTITAAASEVEQKSLKEGFVFEGSALERELKANISKFLNEENGTSLFADTIDGEFNWLDQQLLDPNEKFIGTKDEPKDPGVTRREDGFIEITNPEVYDRNVEILKERVKNNRKFYNREFMSDYLESLRAISNEGVKKYEAKQQEAATRTGESRTYNTALGYYDKNGLRGLVQGVKDGFVSFGKDQDYRKFEDGKFYLTDAKGGKLDKDDKGLTENEMFSKLRVTGYLDMFDFGTATEEQSGGDIPLSVDTMSSLSQEDQDIINSYPSASALQEAVDSGEVTSPGVIDFVNMLKQEAGDSSGTTLDEIANEITPKQENDKVNDKGNARIIDTRSPFVGGDRPLTLIGVTEKEYLEYKKLPIFGKTAEQKKLQKKVKDAIKKARKVADNKK